MARPRWVPLCPGLPHSWGLLPVPGLQPMVGFLLALAQGKTLSLGEEQGWCCIPTVGGAVHPALRLGPRVCASPGSPGQSITPGLPVPSPNHCSVPGIHASLRPCSLHVHSWFPLPRSHSELVGKAAHMPKAAEFKAGQNQNPGLWGPSTLGLPPQHPLSLSLIEMCCLQKVRGDL